MANILIVDDDRSLLEFLGTRFTAMGHACRAESDGQRAYDIIAQGGVELVVLDVMLPGMSGFEICRRMRDAPSHRSVLVMFLSSMCSEEEIAHGLAQGADDFMPKPFRFEQLALRIDRLLAARSVAQLEDAATGLPGPKAIRFELGRLLHQHEPFAAAYVELLKLAEFGKATNEESRAKALRHFGRGLAKCCEECKPEFYYCGHLGGGHFVVLMDRKRVRAASKAMSELWEAHIPKLYAEAEKTLPPNRPGSGRGLFPNLDMLFCITRCEPNGALTPGIVLETLANLRASALERQGTGIHLDRRQAVAVGAEL